jgi:hypothetical protein
MLFGRETTVEPPGVVHPRDVGRLMQLATMASIDEMQRTVQKACGLLVQPYYVLVSAMDKHPKAMMFRCVSLRPMERESRSVNLVFS